MALKKNVGQSDRTIRLAIAGLLVLIGIWAQQIVLSAIALVVLITGVTGVCPLYIPLGINTNKEDDKADGKDAD